MLKKFIVIPLLSLVLIALFVTLGNDTNFTKHAFSNTESSNMEQPNTSNMMETTKALSANSRHYDSNPGNVKSACSYLIKRFESYGYSPSTQSEEHLDIDKKKRTLGKNLIAVKKNTTKTSKGIIIICAHYDSAKKSLGANDDASGCSVVLETARLLKDMPCAYELRFILFCGEEGGCNGSLYYVKKLSGKEKQIIKAVIDIDSIAQKNFVKPRIFTVSGTKNEATEFIKSAKENNKLTISKMNRERSDYAVFDYYKIPALCIGQPYSNKLQINSNKDTIKEIDKSLLKYVANIIINAFNGLPTK